MVYSWRSLPFQSAWWTLRLHLSLKEGKLFHLNFSPFLTRVRVESNIFVILLPCSCCAIFRSFICSIFCVSDVVFVHPDRYSVLFFVIDILIFNSKQQLLLLFGVESESGERFVLRSESKVEISLKKTATQICQATHHSTQD